MADLKVKISEFPPATQSKDSDDIAILQDGINKKIKSPILEGKILDKVEERYVNKNKLGVNNGVATLGSDGKLSESQRFTLDINPSFIPIDLTTPASELDGVFLPTTSGVYVNYGGLNIDLDLGSYLITKIGNTYKSILLAVESTLIANDIDDLRSKEPAYEGQIITLLGYYEAGDKEPLNYKWNSEQGIDDGGSVINTNSGSWLAIFNETLNIKDYGSKGNGFDDDTVYIQKALDSRIGIILEGNIVISAPVFYYRTNNRLGGLYFKKGTSITLLNNESYLYFFLNGNPINFNGLRVFVDVDNYNKSAVTFRGEIYNGEEYISNNNNGCQLIGELNVINKKRDLKGNGIEFSLSTNELFMFKTFSFYTDSFENGYLFTAFNSNNSFSSSNTYNLISWKNKNAIVFDFSYESGNSYESNVFNLKIQPLSNVSEKGIKLINAVDPLKLTMNDFNMDLWDMHVIPSFSDTFIDVFGSNKYFNNTDPLVNSICHFSNIIGDSNYRLNDLYENVTSNINYFNSLFTGITINDSFLQACRKIKNSLSYYSKEESRFLFFYATNESTELSNELAPFNHGVKRNSVFSELYQFKLIYKRNEIKEIFLEIICNDELGSNYTARRYYDVELDYISDFNITGVVYGDNATKVSIETNTIINKSENLLLFNTVLSKFTILKSGYFHVNDISFTGVSDNNLSNASDLSTVINLANKNKEIINTLLGKLRDVGVLI